MTEKSLGLYLHIPFCLQKCRYCDFCSFPGMDAEVKRAYTDAICHELTAHAAAAQSYTVDTVFFGGGTPTCLSTEELVQIARCIKNSYSLSPDVEWTSEVNPATADTEKLFAMREAGFNRISLGMQSAHARELMLLGRVHGVEDLLAARNALLAAGYTNWSLDLMFGIPEQTVESFRATLEEAIRLSPTHLSVYSLQIEEGTPFYRERNSLALPDEEAEAGMASLLYRTTEKAGYRRYEISNFAKPGFESRHNLRYWRMQDYLGFGIAAHSCFAGERFFNRDSLADYLHAPTGIRETEELLNPAVREYETIMLGLRLADGIREADFTKEFGYGFYEKYKERVLSFSKAGLLLFDGEKTHLSENGMALSNTILAEILGD